MVSTASSFHSERRGGDLLAYVLWAGLALAVVYALDVLVIGLWQPLLDLHYFRQTQTALSVYWMLHGGPWLAYETPVLGAPWSIPFEFPIYQWIVAPLAMTGLPLDAAGRIVMFAFYIATLWPLRILCRAAGLGRIAFLATAILFLTSPLYLYWSRTFMMESCALFFSSMALALLAVYLRDRGAWVAVAATASGTIATLTKATTFPAFAFVGGCLILIDLGRRLAARRALAELWRVVVPGIIITLPLILGYVWVYYSDHIKDANEFGRMLTSANLASWNFGTLAQRLSRQLWVGVIQTRVLHDLFGPGVLIAFAAAGAALTRPRFAVVAVLAVVGFLVPFLVFTNLHIIHNYYQYANGIFALAAVGIGIAAIAEAEHPLNYVLAGGILTVLVVSQVAYFRRNFEPHIVNDVTQDSVLRVAQLVKAKTPEDSSILVFGTDWNSIVPYYAERKGLAVPFWIPPPLLDKVLAQPQTYLGDRPLSAIVICPDRLGGYKTRAAAIEQFAAGRAKIGEFGDCQVLAGKK
jgi:hypothetical protein